jgi:hypothetical protein
MSQGDAPPIRGRGSVELITELERLRAALEYELSHTLDDGTKHRVRLALHA